MREVSGGDHQRGPASEQPLVLIADNERAVSTLLQEVLARKGLRTAAVADGAAALRFLTSRPVSLFVCDLDMPKVGGVEVLQKLAAGGNAPPALVVTGFLDAQTEQILSALPTVRGLYRKPFDVLAFADVAKDLASGGRVATPAAQ